MASFSVDITEIIFAGAHSGYKDITITGMPQDGVSCTITGTDTSAFNYRIPGDDQNVYRVYTTGLTTNSYTPYNAVFKITNSSDSSDYVEVQLHQLYSGHYDLEGNHRGVVSNVICDSSMFINIPKDWNSDSVYSTWYKIVYANQNNGGDSTAHFTVLLDGSWDIPTSGVPSWIALTEMDYTDTGFKEVAVSVTNNYDGPREYEINFGNLDNYDLDGVKIRQDGYPSSTSGCTETLTFPKSGGTLTATVNHPYISDDAYPMVDSGSVYNVYKESYSIVRDSKSTNSSIFSITIPENTSDGELKLYITYMNLSGSNSSKYFLGHTTIIQEGNTPSPTLTVDPSVLTYPSSGGGRVMDVTYATSLSTNESSFPDWLGATYVSTGQGSGSYTITAASNTSTSSRSFDFELADVNMSLTVPITQVGGAPAASLNISPTSSSVDSSSGTVDITVSSSGISEVNYVINSEWITYSSKSGSVYTFSYVENNTTSQRQGTITFSGGGISQTFTLTQAESSASSITVSPSSLSFGADASYADISLTYGGTYYNTDAAEVHTWVTVNISDTETGKAAGTVSVASNTTTESRSGNVYFSDELGASIALPIEQAGISFTLSANPSTLNIPASGGSVTTAVTYEGTLSAASLPSWLSETHTDDDANHRTYTVTAASNGPTQERTFNWRLDDDYNHCWVYISQPAAEVPSMVISPTSSSVGNSAGTVDITVRSTNISDISYSISDSWITYSSKNGSVYTFSYAANNTASVRQGSITFSGGGISKTFTLSQEGQGGSDPLSVAPTELNFTTSGGTKSVTVSGGTGTIAVNTGSFPSWLSIASVGNGVYNITASENSGVSRSFDVWFTDEASTTVIVNVSQEASSVKLTVSPSSKSFGSAGGSQVFRVTYNTRINYNTLPSWLSITSSTTTGSTIEYTMTASENTDTSSRNFNWVLTDELTTVTVPISQSGTSGPGPEPEPVEEGSLKVYPKKLRYYSDGGRILVSFTNRPEAGIGYSITYTDGSGWLSVEGVTPNMYVSATANDGIRRRAEIKFYDLSDNTNYVIVPVIQGSVGGYNSIWMDDLYYPENRDTSGNYFYRVVNKDSEQTYFTGISSKPLSWTGNIGGIDIPRLVDNYIKSDFVQQNTGQDWADMHSGYCTVDIYNMTENGYPGVVDATFKYWNDWSRYEKKYDYTRSLNDPINGKGCNNMIIPFCVYYDDEATFTIVDTKKNGNINTYTLSSPSSPFVMRYNSYYDIKKVEYKQDDDVLFSYDMNHCGPGAFIYRNRFGGWDSFLIEGNISKTDNYTKQNYRIKGEYNQEYSINTLKYIDEKRTDSIDIDTTYEASTGWLTDEESERLVFHLLSSPIVYFQNLHKENQLYDTDSDLDIIPVRITASSSEYKKFRNGRRLVNYLITFEKCNIEKVRQ